MPLFKFGLKTLKSFIEKKSLNSEAWHILQPSCLHQKSQHFESISTSSCLNRKRLTTRKSRIRKIEKGSIDRTFKQNDFGNVSASRSKESIGKLYSGNQSSITGNVGKGNYAEYPSTTNNPYGFHKADEDIKSLDATSKENNAENVPGSGNEESIEKLKSGKLSPKSEEVGKGTDPEYPSNTNPYGLPNVDKGVKGLDGTFKENNTENVPGSGIKETFEKAKPGKLDKGKDIELPNYLNQYEKLLRAENILEAKFFMKSSDDSSDSTYSAVGKGKAAKMMTNVEVQRAPDKFFVKFGEAMAFVEIEESDDFITIKKTEVPEAFRGKRIAAQLARHALDYAKNNNLKVKLDCDYVKDFIRLHAQEYEDIVER